MQNINKNKVITKSNIACKLNFYPNDCFTSLAKTMVVAGVRGCPVRGLAFTLSELLITVAVIGVVAALTIPALITNIEKILNPNRKEVIEDRLLEGMNQLNTLEDGFQGSQYENTEGFVRALSKYYKMSQICGSTDLKECFPYSKFTYTDKKGTSSAYLDNLQTSDKFALQINDWFAPAGFISAQGTPFIML